MKKTFINIFAAAAVLAGCNNILLEDAGEGHLSLDLSASEEEYVSVTRASENEDVNEFKIEITRPSDPSYKKTFDRFGDMPQMLPLPSGSYTIKATSPNALPAAFNQPVYGVSHDFQVKVGAVSSEKLTCTLQNVKVTFNLSDAFKTELENYTITVSNGDKPENKLYWTNVASGVEDNHTTKDMTEAGYFSVAPLTVRVDAKKVSDDDETYHEIRIQQPKPKDHFIISLDAKVTGQAGFQIEIDPSVNKRDDEEIRVPGFTEDPVEDEWDTPVEGGGDTGDDNTGGDNTGGDNTGGEDTGSDVVEGDMTITWTGHESVNNEYPATLIDDNLGEVNLIIDVPGKIAGFKVQIDSESEAFMGAVYEMTTDGGNILDLINDPKAIQAMVDVGLLTGDLKGLVQVPFNLTGLLPLIPVVAEPGTDHIFRLTVTDETDYTESWKLTFSLP